MDKFIVNASHWLKKEINDWVYFSPNKLLLEKLIVFPNELFWKNYPLEFACIAVNIITREIFAIRDPFGCEPLFYSHTQETFIFASKLADILESLADPVPLQTVAIEQLLMNCCTVNDVYRDETIYQGIYRLEPASILTIQGAKKTKRYFWQLEKKPKRIVYKDKRDYVCHFSELLHEGIQVQTTGFTRVASEFSGGLDSSSVVTGLKNLNIKSDLYFHSAPKDSGVSDDKSYADALVEAYGIENVFFDEAGTFDLEDVCLDVSQCFSGAPQYFFPIGASNIHARVKNDKHKLLLSGFGGDECASSHAPLSIIMREYWQKGCWLKAYRECIADNIIMKKGRSKLGLLGQLLKDVHPLLMIKISRFKSYALHRTQQNFASEHSIYNSLSEYEVDLLQGIRSHHVRARIEDSAIMAKHYGFIYRYPLLYPKLVEFCHALPSEYKRQLGVNRYLIRQYLAQYAPKLVFEKHQKIGAIMPATIYKMKKCYQSGGYESLFQNLPFSREAADIRGSYPHNDNAKLLQNTLLYTLKLGMQHG